MYNQSQRTKSYLLVGKKSGPNATLNRFFSWVGLALGWGFRRFHHNIRIVSNPTEVGKSQNTLLRRICIARIHPRKCPTVVDLADDMAPTRQRVLDETDQGSLCSERSRS